MWMQVETVKLEHVPDGHEPFLLHVRTKSTYMGHDSLTFWLSEAQMADIYERAMMPLMKMRADRNTK